MSLEALNGPRDQTLSTPWHWVHAAERALGSRFDLDVCAGETTAKAERFYTVADDGLRSPWTGLCWCNPPFDSIGTWVARGMEQWKSNPLFEGVVYLVPTNRTEQGWFQRLREWERKGKAWSAYPAERINYVGGSSTAFFPSMFWGLGKPWLAGIQQLEGPRTADLFGGAA